MGTRDRDTRVRQQCKPIRYSNNLLKHLAPLWETGVSKWNNLLTIKHTYSTTFTYHTQPTDAILAKLPQGQRTSKLKIQLRTAIDTPRCTLLLPAGSEYRKLPKDPAPKATLTSAPSTIKPPLAQPTTPIPHNIPTPLHTTRTP